MIIRLSFICKLSIFPISKSRQKSKVRPRIFLDFDFDDSMIDEYHDIVTFIIHVLLMIYSFVNCLLTMRTIATWLSFVLLGRFVSRDAVAFAACLGRRRESTSDRLYGWILIFHDYIEIIYF